MKNLLSVERLAELIPDGASLMIGGFMGVGSPHRLIDALVEAGRKDLTVIGNDSAKPGFGIGKLISAKLVKRLITSHIGTNPETQRQMLAGDLDVELVPQGTLAERIRAAGFGLGGVLTPTGLGTKAADGKQTVEIDGKIWLLEKPLSADFALVNAKRADYYGNIEYALTACNFNPIMATAARTVIVEAQDLVPAGVISPDSVKTPGVLVDYILERAA